MNWIDCSTQSEVDAVTAGGKVARVSGGEFFIGGVARVHARGSAVVHASGSAVVYASESARVTASGSAFVYASELASVTARGSAVVYASESASVTARGSAVVRASGSAFVHASESASVTARGSAVVYASESVAVYNDLPRLALRRDRPRIVISPIGSRNDSLGVSLPDDGSDPYVYAGCWQGTLTDFEQRVAEVHPVRKYGDEYRAAIAFIRAIAAIKKEK